MNLTIKGPTSGIGTITFQELCQGLIRFFYWLGIRQKLISFLAICLKAK
jgi:hypothetical protein